MAERSKSVALFIFLLFLFIFLAVMIFIFMYNSYTSTANYSTETTKTSVECSEYSFRIVGGSVDYKNGTLMFLFDPTMGMSRAPNALVINTSEEKIETEPVQFTFEQRIKIKMSPVNEFQVYPKGCIDIRRECSVEENKCE